MSDKNGVQSDEYLRDSEHYTRALGSLLEGHGEVLEITVGSDLMAAAWCNGKRTAKVHLTADEYAAIKDAKDANTAFAVIDRIVTE